MACRLFPSSPSVSVSGFCVLGFCMQMRIECIYYHHSNAQVSLDHRS